jgi:YD repeat-containing protein
MSAPQSYGLGLPGLTLTDLWGLIEELELFKGSVYNDTANNPTIGYGFNLTELGPNGTNVTNTLGAVLDQLSYSVTVGSVNYTGNVFQVAAAQAAATGQPPPSVASIVNYFENIALSVKATLGTPSDYRNLQQELNWALQSFFVGQGPRLLSSSFALLQGPPTNGAASNVTFGFPSTPAGYAAAQAVLTNLIQGNQITEFAGAGGSLTISGKSPTLWTSLASKAGTYTDSVTGDQDINGAPPGSQQWEALVSAFYQGSIGSTRLVASGLKNNDPALAWYSLRYLGSSPLLAAPNVANGFAKRNYLQAQVFGINGASTANPLVLAFQDYQMLTQYRSTIVPYEQKFGDDPDGINQYAIVSGSPLANAQAVASKVGPGDLVGGPGATQPANLLAPIQSLAQTFASPEQEIITFLNGPNPLSPLLRWLTATNFARSTDIFVAGPNQLAINASFGDSSPFTQTAFSADSGAEAYANHILLGTGGGDSLTGGLGNDILVAGAGSETLTSGLGDDTIVAGGGADVVNLRSVVSTVDFEFQGQTSLNETLNASTSASGAIDVGGTQLTGSTAAPTEVYISPTDSYDLMWTGAGGQSYIYDEATESLNISGGLLGSGGGGDSITINNFNLAAAEGSGFLGIRLSKTCEINCVANVGVDPPPPNFNAGSTQAYTFATDTASDTAQTITLTLSGVNSSDFNVSVADQVVQRNSDGTFSFVLPAGQTSVSFSLSNTADLRTNATLQLSASLSDPSNPNIAAVGSNTLTQDFVEPTDDPFSNPTATTLYSNGTDIVSPSGVTFDSYTIGAGGSPVSSVSTGNNYIFAVAEPNGDGTYMPVANTSINGGVGNDTINVFFGYDGSDGGVNVINGNGGQDQIAAGYDTLEHGTPGLSTVSIFADSQVNLPTAIADANLDTGSGQPGDFLDEGSINSTIVGGTGNDLLVDDDNTSGVIVAGSGNDTILGGVEISQYVPEGLAGTTWSATFADNQLSLGGNFYYTAGGVNELNTGSGIAPPQGYEGNVDAYGQALGGGDDTIFGGTGQDVIVLSNGNNEVQLGVGDSTVLGGMGENTIIGGGGNNSIIGGGGGDYIADGSGDSLIVGRAGNNTLIGGSGDDTLVAGSTGPNWASSETGDNDVDGGTGNALIYGAGGSDTLIAGDGNSTVFGGDGDESIVGGDGNDELVGGDGSDTIDARQTTGTELIQAGTGNTTIYGGDGSDHIQGTSGTDLIYAGDGGTEATPTEVDVGSGNTIVYGGDGVDKIFGGTGADVLYAGDGGTEVNPTLVKAGSGATTIHGGAGTDYLIDTIGGADSIIAGTGNEYLIGSGSDTLVAGAGDNTLSGAGNLTDVFSSESGDTLVDATSSNVNLEFTSDVSLSDLTISTDLSADNTLELVIQGNDGAVTVEGGAGLNAIQSIIFDDGETLDLTQLIQQADALGGTEATTVAGTNGNLIFDTSTGDSVSGGSGADTISAWGNNDTLSAGSGGTLIDAYGNNNLVYGGIGNDTLDALGTGATLYGGVANELFEVNNSTDVIVGSGVGVDTILSSVSYTLPTLVDTLTLAGAANLTATGNSDSANLITGNSGNDSLVAGSGKDTLVSGTGVDTLRGGTGGDTYVINNSADVIQPATGQSDAVQSSVNYTLQASVASLTLTGSNNLAATDSSGHAVVTGNAGNDTLTGGSAQDTLIAGSGVDTLVAGSGINTLVLNNAADVIQGVSSRDTLEASFSDTMGSGVDNLILTGSGNLRAVGNSDAVNSITGNSGVDTLVAGTGSDTLIGNAGDTYVLNSGFGHDTIHQNSGSGILQFGAGITAASLDLSLTQGSDGNPALLIQDGTSKVTIDGGLGGTISQFEFSNGTTLDLAQLVAQAQLTSATVSGANGEIILNNAAAASLTGGIGNDTIYGYGANDTIIAGSGNQDIFGANAGDVLGGSIGSDTLHGGAGDATLIGGAGNTVMYGGTGNDFYQLTQGATATIYPTGSSGAEVIYLPTGMTMGDFTSIQDPNGDLVLQSLIDNTSAIVKGFYLPSTSEKTWLIADATEAPQFLGHFVGAPVTTGDTYAEQMTWLRNAYASKLGAVLNAIGEGGGSITDPANVIVPGTPDENYQFNGVSVQNVTVTGSNGSAFYMAGSSENEDITTNTTTSSTTETISTPIYTEETLGGGTYFVAAGDAVDLSDQPTNTITSYGNEIFSNVTNASGAVIGFDVTLPAQTELVQTGTRTTTVTIPTETTVTNETQSFTAENITGEATQAETIYATAPFVGTVNVGDAASVSINLGAWNTGEALGDDNNGHFDIEGPLYSGGPSWTPPLGAFIQAGAGNDSIIGTGGADTIAAGTGWDYLDGWMGTTYYVPMQGDSTDVLADDVTASPYGGGEYPQTTLVLPAGVTPQNLQYRVFQDPYANYSSGLNSDISYSTTDAYSQILQLRYGDSTVLVKFSNAGNAEEGQYPVSGGAMPGVSQFQFADGTVLSRAELIAQATLLPNDFNPVVTGTGAAPISGFPVAASSLFSVTDAPDNPISWYQVSCDGAGGGFFALNGVPTYGPFEVTQAQLAQLTYVGGNVGGTDNIQVSAFDGAIWSAPTTFGVTAVAPPPNVYETNTVNQMIGGSDSGPDTLIGGYGGDTLQGSTGQDTYVYSTGGGAETIQELGPSTPNDNTLQLLGGFTAGAISLSESADGTLNLVLDNTGDTLAIDGFNPTDPINSMTLQNFEFSNASNLSFLQLISESTPSSGTVDNADGSTTNYAFNPGNGNLYTAEVTNDQGQTTASYVLQSDGSGTQNLYAYNSDGSYSDTITVTPAGGSATTTANYYNSQSQIVEVDITNPDGSTNDSSYTYNADGSYTDSVNINDADGSWTSYQYGYSAGGQLLSSDVQNSDGSGSYYDYNTQGQVLDAYINNADGSSNDTSYWYNTDGSYTKSVNIGDTDGDWTDTGYNYGPQAQLESTYISNFDGSQYNYWYNDQGQVLATDFTDPNGSDTYSSYTYDPDGSYGDSVTLTPAGGNSAFTAYNYSPQGQLQSADTENPDGSADDLSYNGQGQIVSANDTDADGSMSDSTYAYNTDGSFTNSVATTAVDGTSTTTAYSYNSQGQLTSADTTNADGSVDNYSFNGQGQILSADVTNADGSTNDSTYAYNADGSYTDTVAMTPAGGSATTTVYSYSSQGELQSANTTTPAGSTTVDTYNTQNQILTADVTDADGSTQDSTYGYNTDGSYTDTVVMTPTGGSATTTVYGYNAEGQIQSANISNPDGSTNDVSYNGQGQILSVDIINADGSTNDSTFAYNSDSSYTDTVVTTPASGVSTTVAYAYDAQGQLQSVETTNPDGSIVDNTYNNQSQLTSTNNFVPSSDGSYTDTWSTSAGAQGEYWWNASTSEYQETWQNADGTSFTDTYQYAPGGSPANSGYSFTETYSDSSGDTGSRIYNAMTGTTTVSWDSAQTGPISGTSANDTGFVGLQLDGEVTNTTNDPTYFNPQLSAPFNAFLTAHG